MEPQGLVSLDSPMDFAETLARLKAALAAESMFVFATIDHAAGAAEVGLKLPPTTVVIFGNAKGGTRLMQADQRMGIDLPLRALVWTDESGGTKLSYNDPAWLAARFGIAPEAAPVLGAMQALFERLGEALKR